MADHNKSFDQIVTEIFTRLTAAGITDFNPGSVARTLTEAYAYGLDQAWYALSQTPNAYFIDTAAGEILERRAADYGLSRGLGEFARGMVVAKRSTPAPFSQLIPAGTMFASDSGLVFESLDDVTLNQGATTALLPVKADKAGKSYNLPSGVMLRQVGVAVSLIEDVLVADGGINGGVDIESDTDLRQRLLTHLKYPNRGGAKKDYVRWALSVAGVTSAICLPLARGPGTVDVLITGENGIPDADTVNAVQKVIDQNRPIGANARVIVPVVRVIDVLAQLTPKGGCDLAGLTSAVTAAISAYINSIPVGGEVLISGLANAIHDVPGVHDYALISPAANIQLLTYELAVIGNVNLSLAT